MSNTYMVYMDNGDHSQLPDSATQSDVEIYKQQPWVSKITVIDVDVLNGISSVTGKMTYTSSERIIYRRVSVEDAKG